MFDLTKWLIGIVVIFALINTFLFSIYIVSGESMYPNFKDGDIIFWQKNVYTAKNPARGDIVVVSYPGDPDNKKYVKRVIGLPGEKLEIKNGLVYINDEEIEEKYLDFGTETTPDGVWQLTDNQFFVMGDNRPESNDSRYFGPVEKKYLLGKSLAVIFPDFQLTSDM